MLCTNLAAAQENSSSQLRGDLYLVVAALKNSQGDVSVALNNAKESYFSRGTLPSFRSARAKVNGKKAEFVFEDIPYGEYTIKLYHDENANGKIDVNLLGIPKEDYAFSNNVRGTFGLPAYEKAKFIFDQEEMTLEIRMRP